jgi:hypothetical protein
MRIIITVCILLLTLTFPVMAWDARAQLADTTQQPGGAAGSGNPGGDFCNGIRNTAFKAGESLTYKVYYNLAGMSAAAGEATFNTSFEKFQGKDCYHVVAEGKSYHDFLFKVRDKYESYFDTATLQPYKFLRDVNENGYKTYENVTFVKSAHTAITNSGVYPVEDCIQDVLSATFYARNIDFNTHKPGDKIYFAMFLDRQVYHLYVRYLGKETIRTRYAKFRTIKFKPLLVKGTMFEGGEKMTVWVTDDPNHIAVRVESPIVVGKVQVDMTMYRNPRYPLSSLVDL